MAHYRRWLASAVLSAGFMAVGSVAFCHEGATGGDVPVEYGAKAIQNFERAAANGNLQALVRLGEIYRDGHLVPADPVKALSYFEAAAAKGSPAGKLRLGEAYLRGVGVTADARSGLALLEEAASAGDARAYVKLGDAYSSGGAVEADPARAVRYYEQGAAGGSTQALLRLADAYRGGNGVPADASRAVEYYRRAADQGSAIGKARLGDALIRGRGTKRDMTAGLELVRSAAREGEPVALYLMGEILSRGGFVEPNPQEGLQYYEKAGTAGYPLAYLRLGEIFRDGIIVNRDAKKSIAFYNRAAALGLARATVALGENHANRRYGGASKAKEGVSLIRKAMAEGEPSAAPALANLYLWGASVPRDPRKAVSTLTQAAEQGNVAAAKLLISYYRDGRQNLIGRNLGTAKKLLDAYAVHFSPEEIRSEEILLDSVRARGPREFERIGRLIAEIPPETRTGVVAALRTANPNLFIYVVQSKLSDRGFYDGPLSGRLTSKTIRAVQRLCKESLAEQLCKKGPLSPEAATFVAQLIG